MQAPDFDYQTVLTVLREQYGLDGELSALLGERDQNLRLRASTGRLYVVKICPRWESRLDADFQVAALRHLERKAVALDLPRVVPTRDGGYTTEVESHPLRVVTWIDGDVLQRDALAPDLAASLGTALATLGQALGDFDHPGKARQLHWDLQRALDLRERTSLITDSSTRAAVDTAFTEFERDGLPRFAALRRQVVHSDANPDNVMLDSRDRVVTGFIDFSDAVEAPLVADVAIAGSYLRDVRNPFRLLAPFIAAYHDVTPLGEDELELMQLLLRVRLATTLTMAYWRMTELGHDDPYLQQSLPEVSGAEEFLALLGGFDRREFARELMARL